MPQIEVPDVPREDSIVLDSRNTALIVVDMQNDFAHPEGTLYTEEASRVVPVIRGMIEDARQNGVPVVFTQDWHGEDDPEFDIWGEHARADSWGSGIIEELRPEQGDVQIKKLRYDAFYGTSLDHLLRQWGVQTVIVVGTVANICVLHTAGSAALRYYAVVAAEDGIAAITPFDKAAALRQISFLYRGRVAKARSISYARE